MAGRFVTVTAAGRLKWGEQAAVRKALRRIGRDFGPGRPH